jgi:hypothetical protein
MVEAQVAEGDAENVGEQGKPAEESEAGEAQDENIDEESGREDA